MKMRLASVAMGVLFLGFAALQINDPDPHIWITVYVLAALISFAAAAGKGTPAIPALVALGTLGWAAPLLPQVVSVTIPELFGSFTMKTASIEESREALGLLIVAGWTATLAIRQAKGLSPFTTP
jgi:hypothetical protein